MAASIVGLVVLGLIVLLGGASVARDPGVRAGRGRSGWAGCAAARAGPVPGRSRLGRLVRVDLRVVTLTIPPQEVITRDNVPARVNAVVLFRVIDPVKSVMAVENYAVATSQIAQTTLRSVLGRADLDTLLAHRDGPQRGPARSTIAEQTEPWGVEVAVVEIKDVEIPEAMQRAMAREAEAERERRAKIINARGELQASDGAAAGRGRPQPEPRVAAVALPADPAGTRRRPELHGRLPAADRHRRAVPQQPVVGRRRRPQQRLRAGSGRALMRY